ncbi:MULTISPECIES: hypothetical protein [Sphingobacterium]|uniref:hypothetical protein n=1 Tax=Sphingobacterium TaxID=28453 RepID=UPI0013DCFEA6|nr:MULTISPECIES: hypothetical protein [unclassified Sphingobacterium]
MYIEVEGKTYYISISENERGVSLIRQEKDVIHIAVAARLSQDELISYLKSQDLNKWIAMGKSVSDTISSIQLFDSSFTLIVHQGLTHPYIKNKTIYTSKKPTTQPALDRLRESILLQEIKQHIGFWEELLDSLINVIHLRKLKISYYIANPASKRLTFEKKLVHKSKEFIAYLCSIAVFECLGIEYSRREQLGAKHVKDWKHQQRVFKHEQTGL